MLRLRHCLALPLYTLALVLEYLSAAFAAWIAGDPN
jgi:hypothetical protein